MASDTKKKLHTVNDVAEILGVSPFTIRRGITRGHIASLGIAGRVMIPDSEVGRILRVGIPRRDRGEAPEQRSA